MEIKRNIYYKIVEWKKETNGTKALLIEGARQMHNKAMTYLWSICLLAECRRQ